MSIIINQKFLIQLLQWTFSTIIFKQQKIINWNINMNHVSTNTLKLSHFELTHPIVRYPTCINQTHLDGTREMNHLLLFEEWEEIQAFWIWIERQLMLYVQLFVSYRNFYMVCCMFWCSFAKLKFNLFKMYFKKILFCNNVWQCAEWWHLCKRLPLLIWTCTDECLQVVKNGYKLETWKLNKNNKNNSG